LEAGGRTGRHSLSSDEEEDTSDDEEMLLGPTAPDGDSPIKTSKRGRAGPSSSSGASASGRRHFSTVHSTDDSGGVELVAEIPLSKSTSSTRSGSTATVSKLFKPTDASKMLTPDVAFVNGRRLPASIAEYAIAGDLTEEQLDEYEEQLLRMEEREELKFREMQRELATRVGGARVSSRTRPGASDDTFDDEDVWAEDLVVHPPTRFAYFGFQRDESPTQRGFFSRLFHYSSQHIGAMDGDGDGDGKAIYVDEPSSRQGSNRTLGSAISHALPNVIRSRGSATHKKSGSIKASNYTSKRTNRHLRSTQVTRKRPLSLSDQELLRCIGLDTFVMIRFLRFGFDVSCPFACSLSFWKRHAAYSPTNRIRCPTSRRLFLYTFSC